jgi:hypothetical protein
MEFSRNDEVRQLYLNLAKRMILGLIYQDASASDSPNTAGRFNLEARLEGAEWPSQAHSMIGMHRMNNIQHCLERVIKEGVPGDFVETGVWRGGASIFARTVLEAYGERGRRVWLCDSFEGLPPPDVTKYPQDTGYDFSPFKTLAVSLEQVKSNFDAYGLLDEQVAFLKGWFKDTLPTAPIRQVAVLRLDGDLYESTMDALAALYHKVSPGGYVIVDDYGAVPPCAQAVHDFRAANGITDEILRIDAAGAYWRRRS